MVKKLSLLIALFLTFESIAIAQDFEVLVFSKTEGFRHSSIEDGISAIQQLGADHNFSVDATEDSTAFTTENLSQYEAVIFLSTTGNILNDEQQSAFEQYIQSGGGFAGIHAASDTEYDWPWYGELVGAYFDSHPDIQEATIEVADKYHPSTSFLPDYWVRTDEWYNFGSNPRGKVHVLAALDEDSYSGGNMGYDHPIAWLHSYDGGRAWYTGGGHTEASFSEPHFLNHLLGGIRYAAGAAPGIYEGTVDDKFQVTVVDDNPQDPMQLAVLPSFDVLYVERGGVVKLKDHSTGLIQTAAELNVDDGREDGLLGIALDPDFETNSWLYLFYSPITVSEQRVSRFTFEDGEIDLSTEEILLTIPVQRDECCHSSGDLEFDSQGNLYITTGDNTNPFESDGYAPIDERTGREPFDAQRTSGNTHDLRGKILRIHPEEDGSYSIPDGNLFQTDNDGKQEIFVMGVRNPFRMAVNNETDELFWGDIGPDARSNTDRGPVGYDEFNRTTTAGNFGWPFCIADNIPYGDYNFATNSVNGTFNCDSPVNDSPNNIGVQNLPAAQPAWIYYPYGFFEERPEFGSEGTRSAMAGDVFHFDETNTENGSFPAYHDGALFIMEWTRNWIKEVRFDSNGELLQINSFLDDLELNRPIDLHFGPDGAMYVIEWGTGFSGGNSDARIIKIEYIDNLGNRPPQAVASASVTSGPVPLEVDFQGGRSTDPDPDDELSYSWDLDGDGTEDANTANTTFTYTEAGSYLASLTVTDSEGETSTDQVEITAGNTIPVVTIDQPLNGGFYQAGDTIAYNVMVSDNEQGSIGDGIECGDIVTEPSIGHDDHAHGTGPSDGCKGEFVAQSHGDGPDNVFYVFNAEYTDDGGSAGTPLTGKASSILQRKLKQAEHAIEFIDVQSETTGDFLGGGENIGYINHNSALRYGPVNFEGIEFFTLRYASQNFPATVEVRIDEQNGPLIATVYTSVTGDWQEYDYFTTALDNPGGTHDVYLVFKNTSNRTGIGNVNWMEFHGQGIAKNNADSLKGLAASYFPNTNFSGTPVVRKDPMIAWNWDDESPIPDFSSDGFSVRWEGEVVSPTADDFTFNIDIENGTASVWIDGEQVISSENETAELSLTEGEKKELRVDYVHETGPAAMSLRWSGPNPMNVIHYDYLIPDSDVLSVSNEWEEPVSEPHNLHLSQNYPNPFNPTTQIGFTLPKHGDVTLKVFNVLGQHVKTLVQEPLRQGSYSVTFDAADLSSGIYFYRLEFDGQTRSNKMLLMK